MQTPQYTRERLKETLEVLLTGPVLLYGPPGTGKTTELMRWAKDKQAALKNGYGLYKFAASPGGTWSELIYGNGADPYGRQPLVGVPRPLLQAMGHGMANPETGERPPAGLLVIDDIHEAGEDLLAALYTALDIGDGGCVTLDTGETLWPKPGFAVAATMNGTPDMLPEPILSRFAGTAIMVKEPSQEMYARLDAKVAGLCARDYQNGAPKLTYRHWLRLDQLLKVGLPVDEACLAVRDSDSAKALALLQILANPAVAIPGAAQALSKYSGVA